MRVCVLTGCVFVCLFVLCLCLLLLFVQPGTAAAAGSSWKVLSDDYLIGNKMSDWDKQVHSSEDEDEDE